MALPRSWHLDPDGKLIPFGKTKITSEANFVTASALPAWLTTPTGVTTFRGPDVSYHGCVQLATGANVGDTASVATTPALESDLYEAILFEIEGFRYGTASNCPVDLQFGIFGAGNVGAYVEQAYNAVDFHLHSGAALSVEALYDARAGGESALRRHIGFLLCPRLKEAFFLDSGQIVAWADVAADYSNGLVTPQLVITNQQATAHSCRFFQARLSVWIN